MKLNRFARAVALLLLTVLLCPPLLTAESPPAQSSTDGTVPEYLKKWEFGADMGEDRGPRFFIDPIIPLHHAEENAQVVFLEPRLTYRDHEWLLNLGGGYRRLVRNRAWLLGGNMFYDYETEYSHSRVGWGLEALSSYAELRSNVYIRRNAFLS